MNHQPSGYGLWLLALANIALVLMFAFSFAPPKSKRDWRSMGAFSAFIVALFTEMYGFPLTIYFLSGWLQKRYPSIDIFSHDAGHLWYTLLGWKGDPHLNPFHLASTLFIIGGFWIVGSAWQVLHQAQQQSRLAVEGPYAYVRHPQYVGFMVVMFGFLLQWPTLLTLLMFPILVVTYVRLARREEDDARSIFGTGYDDYARQVPAFFPRLSKPKAPGAGVASKEVSV